MHDHSVIAAMLVKYRTVARGGSLTLDEAVERVQKLNQTLDEEWRSTLNTDLHSSTLRKRVKELIARPWRGITYSEDIHRSLRVLCDSYEISRIYRSCWSDIDPDLADSGQPGPRQSSIGDGTKPPLDHHLSPDANVFIDSCSSVLQDVLAEFLSEEPSVELDLKLETELAAEQDTGEMKEEVGLEQEGPSVKLETELAAEQDTGMKEEVGLEQEGPSVKLETELFAQQDTGMKEEVGLEQEGPSVKLETELFAQQDSGVKEEVGLEQEGPFVTPDMLTDDLFSARDMLMLEEELGRLFGGDSDLIEFPFSLSPTSEATGTESSWPLGSFYQSPFPPPPS